MKLLLISSSFVAGKGYLEHCTKDVEAFLNSLPQGEVLFIPYATADRHLEKYLEIPQQYFKAINQPFRSIHTCEDPAKYIANTKLKAIFIGGGNTFLLAKGLQDKGLLEVIRDATQKGVGYIGVSAGSNIACPTIQTTNDMPIVQPKSFQALGLVNFQINPHFVAGSLVEGHKGETREQRIDEYHKFNPTPVIGLPETSCIQIMDGVSTLKGKNAVIFEKDRPAREWLAGTNLNI